MPEQNIHNHIMLAYELIRGYTRKNGTPRCMMQLDLQKAYDMVDWRALEDVMQEIGLPRTFTNWIMTTVKTVSYSFNINGQMTEDMQACRGIRQGDPISPLLFVIMMEYFNRMFDKMQQNPNFNHHAKCEKMGITHLTFADDVLLFCRGDSKSVDMMLDTVQNFSDATGLVINLTKCKIFFGGIDDETKGVIKRTTNFKEGHFPIRYLGVPLTSKKLTITHYLPLVEKIVCRTRHWTTRLLSHAGRIQLVKSISFSITQYWMLCFPIPKFVLKKIEAICRSFIWTGCSEVKKKSPVAWETVCRPKCQGGLDIINLTVWNQVTMMKCLWNLCRKSDNLWVKWIHMYYLKKRVLCRLIAGVIGLGCSTIFWIKERKSG